MEPVGIGLADALEALRSELALARARAVETDVQFPIDSVTVEFKVGVTSSKDGKVGFRVPMVGVELGGSIGFDRETMQTLTLVLGAPVDRLGNPLKVASTSDSLEG